MADYRNEKSKISWTTIKIKTLVMWISIAILVIGGGGAF